MRNTIHFRSRKDLLFGVFLFGFNTIGILMAYYILTKDQPGTLEIFTAAVTLLVCVFLLWSYFGTSYRLSAEGMTYRSGPLRGTIALERIREIVVGKTLWVGLRPATARKGLIIKYDRFEEIYISPESNEDFIQKVLELRSDISIVDPQGVLDLPPGNL